MIRRHVVDIGGVLVSSAVMQGVLAFVILLVLRPLLGRLGFQRIVWNPPLAELALLVCIFALIVLL